MTRSLSWRRKLVYGLVGTLLALLAVEAAGRVAVAVYRRVRHVAPAASRPWQQPEYAQTDWAEGYWREQMTARGPWAAYVGKTSADQTGQYINNQGDERLTWQPEPLPEAEVWCFGGSAMWSYGARDEGSIPSHLSRRLAAEGRPRRVRNLASPGFVSAQSLVKLTLMLRDGGRPELVVFYDGYNDLGVAAAEDSAPGEPIHAGTVRFLRDGGPLRAWLWHVGRELPPKFVITTLLDRGLRRLRPVAQLRPEPTEALAAEVVAIYLANVAQVRQLAAAYGFQPVFFWQPMRAACADHPAGRSPSVDVPAPYARAARRHLDWPSAGGDQIDLNEVFAHPTGDGFFFDACHTYESANAQIAAAIAASLPSRP